MNDRGHDPLDARTEPDDGEGASRPDTGGKTPSEDGKRIPDSYYKGVIERIFRGSRSGVIRSASGRELTFKFDHLRIAGAPRRFEDLREGASVGFDVGHTSNGLLVTVLRLED